MYVSAAIGRCWEKRTSVVGWGFVIDGYSTTTPFSKSWSVAIEQWLDGSVIVMEDA